LRSAPRHGVGPRLAAVPPEGRQAQDVPLPHSKEETPMPSLFSRIISGEIPADIVYRDDQCTAFRDIQPLAPVHVLIVPNKEIPTVNDLTAEDEQLVGHLFTVAARIATQEGIAADGYRLLINCNQHGGQEIFHLHMHLLGGRFMGPMVVRQ
jgi:histidine triad (HIT) family protein